MPIVRHPVEMQGDRFSTKQQTFVFGGVARRAEMKMPRWMRGRF